MVRTAAIVPAAGRGERLGPGAAKALRVLGAESLLELTVRRLAGTRGVDLIVVAVPAENVDELSHSLTADVPLKVVAGGATRQQSVAAGLAVLPKSVEFVLVHDAARALAPSTLHEAIIAQLVDKGANAVVPVLPVSDTVKVVEDDIVMRTVDRTTLRAVQTPQGFTRAALERAHQVARDNGVDDVTDDAGLCEAAGISVRTIPGDPIAFKITRPLDWTLAEAVVGNQ
jgi:2-C-methyl-D-erythritol 4-phosphate cytidylyltransferase